MLVSRVLLALMLVLSACATSRAASAVAAPCPSKVVVNACLVAQLQPVLLPGAQDGPSCAAKAIPVAALDPLVRQVRPVRPVQETFPLPEGTLPGATERPPRVLQA